MQLTELNEFLHQYFEVLYTQDLNLFDKVFHKDCVLYSQQDGVTTVRPFAQYRDMVQGRASPQAGNYPRDETVLMIDQLAPDMAVIKVRLRLFNNMMEDHLNLMRVNGQWMIFAKHFYRVDTV